MVSRNNNEICLDKVFEMAKDKQIDYIEKSREVSSAKPQKIKGRGRGVTKNC